MKLLLKASVLMIIILNQCLQAKNKGLEWGANSCYFDSSIQALSHLDKFNDEIRKYNFDEMSTSKMYLDLVDAIKNSWTEKYPYLKRNFKINSNVKLGEFHLGWTKQLEELVHPHAINPEAQQDAPEFILNFLNTMEKDRNKFIRNLVATAKEFGLSETGAETQAIIQMQDTNLKDIFEFIEIKSETTMQCQGCKKTGTEINKFKILPLDIPNKDNITLIDCLEMLAKEEIVSDVYCESCKDIKNASRITKLNSLPKYLIIQFLRSQPNEKITVPITFPLNLYISHKNKFMSSTRKQPLSFKLLAFIVHGGPTTFSGHYWAYGRDIQNNWFLYNDEYVSDAGSEKNLKSNALFQQVLTTGLDNNVPGHPNATPYMLFYEREEKSQPPEQSTKPLQLKLKALKSSLQALKLKLETLRDKLGKLKRKVKN